MPGRAKAWCSCSLLKVQGRVACRCGGRGRGAGGARGRRRAAEVWRGVQVTLVELVGVKVVHVGLKGV